MNVDDITSTASARNTSYLSRPQGRIGYDVAGEGPLIVLVPGMGDLRAGYRFLAPALREAGYTATATRPSRPTATRKPPPMSLP